MNDQDSENKIGLAHSITAAVFFFVRTVIFLIVPFIKAQVE